MTARRRSTEGARSELARLLVDLRGARHQAEVAAAAGITQSKVSRAERDEVPLAPADAAAYAEALGASPQRRARLLELSEAAARAREAESPTALVRRATMIQKRIRVLTATASAIQGWQERMILGNLQTPAYTAALLEGDGKGDPGAAWWAARRARVALLDEPGRTWHLLMSEAALRWGVAPAPAMAAQLAHLVEVSGRANVRLGVVPLDVVHGAAPPVAFHLYDGPHRTASVATPLGTAFHDRPADVAVFDEEFARLAALALYDDAARDVLDRVRRTWRAR